MPIDSTKDPKARFYVEAGVAVAKSASFAATAEDEVEVGNLIPAGVSAYYSLFHLALGLMWILPDRMPTSLHQDLMEIRDDGKELPNRQSSHRAVENFVCAGQMHLSLPQLRQLFTDALALREFASYGPSVTYAGDQPYVNSKGHVPKQVVHVVEQLPGVIVQAIEAAKPHAAYDGDLAQIIVENALDGLSRADFPFMGWFSEATLSRARKIVAELLTLGSA